MAYIGTKSKSNSKCPTNNPTNEAWLPLHSCPGSLLPRYPAPYPLWLHKQHNEACSHCVPSHSSFPTLSPQHSSDWLLSQQVVFTGFSSRKCLLTSPCLPADCLVAGWTGLLPAELILPPLPPWGHRSLSLSCFPFYSSESHKTCLGIWPMGFLPFSLTSSHLRHQLQELLGDAHVVQLQELFPDNIQTIRKVERCVKVLQRECCSPARVPSTKNDRLSADILYLSLSL